MTPWETILLKSAGKLDGRNILTSRPLAVRLRAEQFVGRAALWLREVSGEPVISLGYAVVSSRWGEGFASEMAEAVLEVGFGPLQLPEISCFTLPSNQASLRVMEKLGFRPDQDVTFAGLPHRLGTLRASEWAERKAQRGSL